MVKVSLLNRAAEVHARPLQAAICKQAQIKRAYIFEDDFFIASIVVEDVCIDFLFLKPIVNEKTVKSRTVVKDHREFLRFVQRQD